MAVALWQRGLLRVRCFWAPGVGGTHPLLVLQVQQPEDELAFLALWSSSTKEQKAEPAAPSLSAGDI